MVILIIILSILAFLILATFVVSFVIYLRCFYNDRKNKPQAYAPISKPDYLPYMDEMNALLAEAKSIKYNEYVYIKSFDGKKLAAKLYFRDDSSPFIIEIHGYKGSGVRDFSGGLTEFYRRGYNVLLIDHRGHGESDGKTIIFGVKESKDIFLWIKYLNERFNYPEIILYGISMGGNTVLNVSKMDLSANVLAIISDCPYSTPFDIIKSVAESMGINAKLLKPFIYISAFLFAHVNLNNANALKAVKETKVPILLIHGTSDLLVPYQMSVEIQKSNPKDIDLLLVEKAPHGLSYVVDKELVVSKLFNFLDNVKQKGFINFK